LPSTAPTPLPLPGCTAMTRVHGGLEGRELAPGGEAATFHDLGRIIPSAVTDVTVRTSQTVTNSRTSASQV
jgi:hypothetical protein